MTGNRTERARQAPWLSLSRDGGIRRNDRNTPDSTSTGGCNPNPSARLSAMTLLCEEACQAAEIDQLIELQGFNRHGSNWRSNKYDRLV